MRIGRHSKSWIRLTRLGAGPSIRLGAAAIRAGPGVPESQTMTNKKQTSDKAAAAASKVLRDGRTGAASKTAAGSALSQAKGNSGKKAGK